MVLGGLFGCCLVLREPVVHSLKWATGSWLFGAFDPVSALFPGASGPLERVDHWLAAFWAFEIKSL